MNKIKELWASLFIPRHSCYCHHKFKHKGNGRFRAKRCRYWCMKDNMEYCKYLKEYLDIQDQVKDCGINED